MATLSPVISIFALLISIGGAYLQWDAWASRLPDLRVREAGYFQTFVNLTGIGVLAQYEVTNYSDRDVVIADFYATNLMMGLFLTEGATKELGRMDAVEVLVDGAVWRGSAITLPAKKSIFVEVELFRRAFYPNWQEFAKAKYNVESLTWENMAKKSRQKLSTNPIEDLDTVVEYWKLGFMFDGEPNTDSAEVEAAKMTYFRGNDCLNIYAKFPILCPTLVVQELGGYSVDYSSGAVGFAPYDTTGRMNARMQ